MLGALLKATIETRTRRAVLLEHAATQRQRMGEYLDALDPAAQLLDRLIGAVRYVLARPVIPAAILAVLVLLKPKRTLKVAILAWKGLSWFRRAKAALH